MIAPPRLVAGQGVGRDISFNVEGTSLNLKQGTPCSLWGDGCPASVLCTRRGQRGAGCSGPRGLSPHLAGDGVWGPFDPPITAGRDMGPGGWPGPAQSSLTTQTCPLYPGCFGGVSSPCLRGTV